MPHEDCIRKMGMEVVAVYLNKDNAELQPFKAQFCFYTLITDENSSAQVFGWHKALKKERKAVEHEQCSGGYSTSRTNENVIINTALDLDRC